MMESLPVSEMLPKAPSVSLTLMDPLMWPTLLT